MIVEKINTDKKNEIGKILNTQVNGRETKDSTARGWVSILILT